MVPVARFHDPALGIGEVHLVLRPGRGARRLRVFVPRLFAFSSLGCPLRLPVLVAWSLGLGAGKHPRYDLGPRLLGLLIYSYATGVFDSRQIERTTYESVATRLLCADTHPDHVTICTFRRENRALLGASFPQVLEMKARCGVLKVGGISVAIDGTKVLANASKHAPVSYE